MSEKLKGFYCDAMDSIRSKPELKDKTLTGFYHIKGTGWEKNRKLLFIGRAVNGWKPETYFKNTTKFSEEEKNAIVDKIIKASKPKSDNKRIEVEPLDWIIKQWNKASKDYYNSTQPYTVSRSAFWGIVKGVSEEILESNKDEWIKFIAWSNLYKFAYRKDNPGIKLMNSTIDTCKKMLYEEIKLLKPDVIVFLTDDNWYKPFEEVLDRNRTAVWKTYKSENIIKYGNLESNDKMISVIVTRRPEYRERSNFIKEIVQIIQKVNEQFHAIDLERAVISKILRDPDTLQSIKEEFKEDYFSDMVLKNVCSEILEYKQVEQKNDLISYLTKRFPEDENTTNRLNQLLTQKPSENENISYWLIILRNKYLLRKLHDLLIKYNDLVEKDVMDCDEIIKKLKEEVDWLYGKAGS